MNHRGVRSSNCIVVLFCVAVSGLMIGGLALGWDRGLRGRQGVQRIRFIPEREEGVLIGTGTPILPAPEKKSEEENRENNTKKSGEKKHFHRASGRAYPCYTTVSSRALPWKEE